MRRTLTVALAGMIAVPLVPLVAARNLNDQDDATNKIKHVVVIFGENVSFDHYFATYPHALNQIAGEPVFHAADGTPTVNGIVGGLLSQNPNNFTLINGTSALNSGQTPSVGNPFRLTRAQARTADQNHDYNNEQIAADHGLLDQFPYANGVGGYQTPSTGVGEGTTTAMTMGYYDGNTVTALWNYAQHYAMSDNAYGTTYGPSTVGALNLISGQTNGVVATMGSGLGSSWIGDGNGGNTVIGDPDPLGDACAGSTTVQMGGTNVGDLLNGSGISWGWFEGGFDLTVTDNGPNGNGLTGCNRGQKSATVAAFESDYSAHHQPFQYYATTRNELHTRPTSVGMIGHQGDAANHEYDINDFYAAVNAGNMPSVSFLKAIRLQDAHPGNSTPLDEQAFIVHVLNFLQSRPEWDSTAVIIAYDDSDGWYDHQLAPVVNQSQTTLDFLSGPNQCGTTTPLLAGIDGPHAQGRCGYGPRLPLMVISPWAKRNFVDHTLVDQSSILKFIEDTFLGGERIGGGSFDAVAHSIRNMFDFDRKAPNGRLVLDETTGRVVSDADNHGKGDGQGQDHDGGRR